jgi:hypothetical protein
MSNWRCNARVAKLFLLFFGGVRANAMLSRKTLSEHRGVIYQTNQKRALYNTAHSLGVLGQVMNY